jgi:hypothetical protein
MENKGDADPNTIALLLQYDKAGVVNFKIPKEMVNGTGS